MRMESPEEAGTLTLPAEESVEPEDEEHVFSVLDAIGEDEPETI